MTEKKIWSKILLNAKRNKLYSFEEETSQQKSESAWKSEIFQQIFVKTKINF